MYLDRLELADLLNEVSIRFSKANEEGNLPDLLSKLGWESLLPKGPNPLHTMINGKILVIGGQTVSVDNLRHAAKKAGFNLARFEFELGYDEAKTFNCSKLAYNEKYRVILIGSTPHSTVGTGQSSSLVTELQNHPDKYPRVIPLRTEEGTLRITKSNFMKALKLLKQEQYICA